VSPAKNIPGAKLEKHCFNISRDIIHSVFCNVSCTPYNIITFPIWTTEKRQHLQNEKRQLQKGKCHHYSFEKPVKQAAAIFHFIGTLNEKSRSPPASLAFTGQN